MADDDGDSEQPGARDTGAATEVTPTAAAGQVEGQGAAPARDVAAASLVGQMVGSIRVVEVIGRGGFGEVYAGYDEKLGRKVALKALRVDRDWESEGRGRFLREARMLSQLDHPNICRIHDLVSANGRDVLVLELLSGTSLSRLIRGGCPRSQQLTIAEQIARALAAAHEKGIVHRDLKPDNVMITAGGVVKVLDFGLARPFAEPETLDLRWAGPERAAERSLASREVFDTYALGRAGAVMGTPAYMSPEQARGEPATPASDLYSFGLLLQELLSGRRPFDEQAGVRGLVLRASLGESAPFEGDDRDLVTLVGRLKSPAPASRPSALDAAERLRWVASKSRRLRLRLLAAGVAATLVVTTAVAVTQGVRASRAARRAEHEAETARQVSEFLTKLFEVSDPGEARGRTITAREILDEGSRRIEAELGDQPLVQARLMTTIGGVYLGLGLYRDAEQLLVSALAIREKLLGPDDPEVAEAVNNAAEACWRQGRYEDAESLLRRALAIRERTLGPDHPAVAESLTGLGITYRRRGRHAEAEPLYARALAIRERACGPASAEVAESLNDLGILYGQEGKYAQAEPLLVRALAIEEQLYGRDGIKVASAANSLAVLHWSQGKYAEAEPLYRRALDIRLKVLGPDHASVALSTSNLASLYRQQERFADALALYDEAAEVWEKAVGTRSRELAGALLGVSVCRFKLGDLDAAIAAIDRSLGIVRDLASQAPQDRDLQSRIGRSLVVRGRIETALGRRADGRASWAAALSALDPLVRSGAGPEDQSSYAQALLYLDRVDEAGPVVAKLLASGYTHPELFALCREHGLATS